MLESFDFKVFTINKNIVANPILSHICDKLYEKFDISVFVSRTTHSKRSLIVIVFIKVTGF